MPEPQATDVLGWFGTVVSSVVAAIGSVVAWLRGMKQSMEARIAAIENVQHSQSTEIAVLHSEQKNSHERVADILEMVRLGNEKLDDLREQLTKMYVELRNQL